jgi:hypothetical protein
MCASFTSQSIYLNKQLTVLPHETVIVTAAQCDSETDAVPTNVEVM